jgi:arginyl-tRNA synthetase
MEATTICNSLQLEIKIENELKNIIKEIGVQAEWPKNSYLILPSKEKGYDLTFSIFPFTKELKKKPDEVAELVLVKLKEKELPIFSSYIRTQAYIQLKIATQSLAGAAIGEFTVQKPPIVSDQHILIEYSSPNTNKPQHLGHVRNNCLGAAVSLILKSQGHKVTKIVLVNDRGIHICKSMLAYKKFGQGETPESIEMKGDHFVGKYYVEFEKQFVAEFKEWLTTDQSKEEFEKWKNSSTGKTAITKALKEHQKDVEKEKKKPADQQNVLPEFDPFKLFQSEYRNYYMGHFSKLGTEANEMLVKWEEGDKETKDLWLTMNGWVFKGFKETYDAFGVSFDVWEKESEIYEYGKEVVLQAFEKGQLKKFENGAIGCDLVEIGVLKANTGEERNKALLRANGTSVYMTQDVGTALNRLKNYKYNRAIYVVGNEQERHFEILFKLIEHLQPEMKGSFFHLSYGMVNLPSGRMKSREGTVVDADDLLKEVSTMAYDLTKTKWPTLSEEDLTFRANKIALSAIKFFILSFGPATTVLFDPAASLQFKGKSGPYLLYQYARTRSIIKKAGLVPEELKFNYECLSTLGTTEEMDVLRKLYMFPKELQMAAKNLDPSKVTDAAYEITKSFNLFYKLKDKHQVVNCENPVLREARLLLVLAVGVCVRNALELCGIEVLEHM